MYSSLPLHVCHVQKLRATLNRIHILFHFVAILSLIYYRISHLFSGTGDIPVVAWTLITISEVLISFVWFFTQSFRWRPVLRKPFPERIPGDEVLPAIDVFICTVDPKKEPTVEVMNTVLSAMSLDYPPEKLAVYLSDDGGSALTLFAIKEAAFFARSWLPFCRKYELKTRCPQAYFSSFGDEDRREKNDDFKTEEMEIKTKYEKFKESVEKAGESGGVGDTYIFHGQDRPPLVKVISDSNKDGMDQTKIPLLVYASRERRPSYPHRFKAGALNSLLRVSGIISNAPYILVLDCDMYCNDPTSARQAMCFHLDPNITRSLAFVQFPQIFYNVSKNDIYDGQARSAYKTKWQGMDGLSGPLLSGTGFYLKRHALYRSPEEEDTHLLEARKCFGSSNKFLKSLRGNSENNTFENELSPNKLLEEAHFLASCTYEEDTQWGDKIGFSYKCLLESTFTGYLLQCKGWKSVYCFPTKPAFLGCATIDMKDALVQLMKWTSGLLGVGLSKFCPLTYGLSRMSFFQTMCYGYFCFHPFFSVALLLYGIVPQLCFLNSIPLYPKVSSPWFALFAFIYISSISQHLLEVLYSGGSLRTWWNEQRIWIIKSVTASLFGCVDVHMKWIGVKKAEFRLTNKVVYKDKMEKYVKGKFDFEGASFFMVPLMTLVLLNIVCFIGGLRKVIIQTSYNEMFGQIFLSFLILVLSYSIIEGILSRKGKGSF